MFCFVIDLKIISTNNKFDYKKSNYDVLFVRNITILTLHFCKRANKSINIQEKYIEVYSKDIYFERAMDNQNS